MGQKPQVLQGQGGFTLIELMVTIAVLAIVVTIAAPSFTTMINNNRSIALGEELVTALNYTRAEAVKRGQSVSICASSDGATCTGTWTDGWIVADIDDNVLRHWQAPNAGAAIAVTRGGNNITSISYARLGTLDPATQVNIVSSINGCGSNAARTITIGPAGLINVARSNCS
ncbi:GspH/FimT family pseudopilin [Microbulbifer rhizosphaerae]|uniref:Type II secretion system protein H n=1 Tax=Microbulbifer rhizosphaerae TaxID=1562603 RepID=A0A7W4ZC27_9GAMM|nr:GspH/FimT family pseudopilin [Microbulbifer rhizosphaerae]MBB3063029.1 type IV fimbrial biogenesis protein FimT [Microbulbifer rhizosphaerae]